MMAPVVTTRRAFPSALVAVLALAGAAARADAPADVVRGPATAKIADVAEIKVPEGFAFAGHETATRSLRAMGNLVGDEVAGLLEPAKADWFVVFFFDKVGYVKDDEKATLDAAALLEQRKQGSERANEERARAGLPLLHVVGWSVPPHYDETTHNLEWGLRLTSTSGGQTVNYEVRLLGRRGVMRCTWVGGPDELQSSLPWFRTLLADYSFTTGERYAEYRQGDEIAKMGLTALIAGGAAAVAYKTGLLKYLWKFGVLILAGSAAAIKRVWNRFFGKQESVDS